MAPFHSYGDFSPKSNIGKPFFIVWSIIAVPTMTVLIQEMSKTVIAAINNWTFTIADFTVLPKKGVFKLVLNKSPALKEWLVGFIKRKQGEKRIREGFQLQSPDDIYLERLPSNGTAVSEEGETVDVAPDIKPGDDAPRVATEEGESSKMSDAEETDHELARQVAQAIKSIAQDLRAHPPKRYSFEQWVCFTKLIRFSRCNREEEGQAIEEEEQDEELLEWDWIGEDSPMLADITEAEWVLNRLCESLNRYTKRQARLG